MKWAVQKVKWLAVFSPITVVLPEEELVQIFRLKDVHPKIRVTLYDLELYRVKFQVGRGAWQYS